MDPGADPTVPAWRRLQHTFEGYGAGVRFLEFEDGGDPAGWGRSAGLKLTGASAVLALAPPLYAAPQLVRNGSAQDGLSDGRTARPSVIPGAS